MSTISTANVRTTKATGTRAKKESGKTTDASAPYALELPSAKTLASMANAEAGNLRSFDSVDELMDYFDKA